MTDTTAERTHELRAVADALIDEFGRSRYAALPPTVQAAQRRLWKVRMMAQTGCSRQAALKHVERAANNEPTPKRGQYGQAGEPAKE